MNLPSLDQLAADPSQASGLPLDATERLLAQVHVIESSLLARLLAVRARSNGQPNATDEADELLTAKEAAQRLGISLDTIYRKKWPFEVRPTPGTRRFSTRGIEKFIRQRQGR